MTDSTPTASPQAWDTAENTALTVNAGSGVLANAHNDAGDPLTAQLVSGPGNGTLQLNGSGAFVYTPNAGFVGTDSFQYAASDGVSTSSSQTVSIQVDETIADNQNGSVPSAVATGDFNGDGNPDVIEADKGLNTVSVYLDGSNGNVATTPISTTTVGQGPVALAVGDFNSDGKEDVAVANSGSNSVSILLGNGDGTFTTGTTLTGFNDPVAVVAGDFNGDGKTDLAVVNEGSDSVSILLGNGNGTFTSAGSLTAGSSPTSIAASDFNNDGKTDLVVTNSGSNSVSVFLGNGDGSFAAPLTDAVGTAPAAVAVGNFNGDGNEDLAVANSGSNNVSVLLGNGDGTFQAASNYAVGSDPVAVAAGDFNGDGYVALSVANKGSNTLTDLANFGDGQYFALNTTPAVSDPVSIATADFNHDGLTDQFIALADPGGEEKNAAVQPQAIFVPQFMATQPLDSEVAVADPSRVIVYDTANPQAPPIFEQAVNGITCIAVQGGSGTRLLAVGVPGGQVTIYNIDTKKVTATFQCKHTPSSLSFSDDGDVLVAGYPTQTPEGWVGKVVKIDPKKGTVISTSDLTNTKHIANVAPITQIVVDKLNPRDATYSIVTKAPDGFTTWTYDPKTGTAAEVKGVSGPRGVTATTLSQGFTDQVTPDLTSHSFFAAARSDGAVDVFYIDASGSTLFAGQISVGTPVQSLSWFSTHNLLNVVTATGIRQFRVSFLDANRVKIVPKPIAAPPKLQNPVSSAPTIHYQVVGQADGSILLFDGEKLTEYKTPLRPANKK